MKLGVTLHGDEAHLVDEHLRVQAVGRLVPVMSAVPAEGEEFQTGVVFAGKACAPFVEPHPDL